MKGGGLEVRGERATAVCSYCSDGPVQQTNTHAFSTAGYDATLARSPHAWNTCTRTTDERWVLCGAGGSNSLPVLHSAPGIYNKK
jgi:hypothetical protein